METDGVAEAEVAQVLGGEQPVLHLLVDLGDDFEHVGDVPVADVGAEDDLELLVEGVGLRVEGPGGLGVVGLDAEEEAGDEALDDVLGPLPVHRLPVVERPGALLAALALDQGAELVQARAEVVVAVLLG